MGGTFNKPITEALIESFQYSELLDAPLTLTENNEATQQIIQRIWRGITKYARFKEQFDLEAREYAKDADITMKAFDKEVHTVQREAICICMKLVKGNQDIAFARIVFQVLYWFYEVGWPSDMDLVMKAWLYNRVADAKRFVRDWEADPEKAARVGPQKRGRIPTLDHAYELMHISDWMLNMIKTPDEKV